MVVVTHEPLPEVEKESMLATPSLAEYEGNSPYLRDQTLRNSYNIPVEIRDVKTALDFLCVAISSKDRILLQKCVESLDALISVQNVLKIYKGIGDSENCRTENYKPSAPPYLDENQRNNNNSEWITILISDLRHNCLLEIDKNADVILQNNEILNLSYQDILTILQRDTLQVSSEAIVYKTVFKWATNICQKDPQNFKDDPYDIKNILQDLAYAPRYGLMTKSEFMGKELLGIKGPRYSGLLDEKEWRSVKFYLKEKNKGRPVDPLRHKMSCPRIIGTARPNDLSIRSKNLRKVEEEKGEKRGSGSSECSRKTAFEKCLLSLFTCWSFIFD